MKLAIHVLKYTYPSYCSDGGSSETIGVATTVKEAWELAKEHWEDEREGEGTFIRHGYQIDSFELDV